MIKAHASAPRLAAPWTALANALLKYRLLCSLPPLRRGSQRRLFLRLIDPLPIESGSPLAANSALLLPASRIKIAASMPFTDAAHHSL